MLERGLRESVQAGRSSSREERFASCRTFDPVWRSWPWAARRRASPCRPVSQFHKPRLPPATMSKVGWSAATCRAQKQQQQQTSWPATTTNCVGSGEMGNDPIPFSNPASLPPEAQHDCQPWVCNFAAAIKVECHRALLSPEGDLDCGGRCSYHVSDRRLWLQERAKQVTMGQPAPAFSVDHTIYRQRRVRRAMFTPV